MYTRNIDPDVQIRRIVLTHDLTIKQLWDRYGQIAAEGDYIIAYSEAGLLVSKCHDNDVVQLDTTEQTLITSKISNDLIAWLRDDYPSKILRRDLNPFEHTVIEEQHLKRLSEFFMGQRTPSHLTNLLLDHRCNLDWYEQSYHDYSNLTDVVTPTRDTDSTGNTKSSSWLIYCVNNGIQYTNKRSVGITTTTCVIEFVHNSKIHSGHKWLEVKVYNRYTRPVKK